LYILLGLNGVPKLIVSNIDAENGTELNNDLWIIMEHIEGVTLYEFMRNHSISLRDELLITLHLLDIVKQIHSRHVIHGSINPQNIIIKTESIPDNDNSQFSCDKISLLLTDFSLASINQENKEDNEQNGRMFFPTNQNPALAVGYNYSQPQEIFYRAPQIEMQPAMNDTEKNKQQNFWHSPTIDTSHIGAILFYMITKCYPRESRDIHGQAPHEIKKHISIINEELKKATGK
jgi:serine/threonine protein kinase